MLIFGDSWSKKTIYGFKGPLLDMKKTLTCAAFLLFGALTLSAAPADVHMRKGTRVLKPEDRQAQDVQIGDSMNTGDS